MKEIIVFTASVIIALTSLAFQADVNKMQLARMASDNFAQETALGATMISNHYSSTLDYLNKKAEADAEKELEDEPENLDGSESESKAEKFDASESESKAETLKSSESDDAEEPSGDSESGVDDAEEPSGDSESGVDDVPKKNSNDEGKKTKKVIESKEDEVIEAFVGDVMKQASGSAHLDIVGAKVKSFEAKNSKGKIIIRVRFDTANFSRIPFTGAFKVNAKGESRKGN